MIPSQTYGTMYYVDNMTESIKYYETVLGFSPTHKDEFWTEFEIKGHKLCLHAKHPGGTFPENVVLIMSKDGIQKLHDGMKGDGYNVFGLHQIQGEMYSFHFKDKSNNELSFFGKLN